MASPGGAEAAPAGDAPPSSITLMTFNVEEYQHGFSGHTLGTLKPALQAGKLGKDDVRAWVAKLRAYILEKAAFVGSIVSQHSPDVLCLQEHSLGLDPEFMQSWGLGDCVGEEQRLDEAQLLAVVLPHGYRYFSAGTSERPAKYSELANVVAWNSAKLEVTAQVGELITPGGKKTPDDRGCYTPRSAACVELRAVGGGAPFVVCSTHLMGGRFEDRNWAADHELGANERVNQVLAIEEVLASGKFARGAPSIIAGDFNVMRRGFVDGPFAQGSRRYVFGETMLYTRERLERDYLESYVPYQTAVHDKLEELGYALAYGRGDDREEMKTSRYGGCTDWIYSRGMASERDEVVVETGVQKAEGASDHNAVKVTLSLA